MAGAGGDCKSIHEEPSNSSLPRVGWMDIRNVKFEISFPFFESFDDSSMPHVLCVLCRILKGDRGPKIRSNHKEQVGRAADLHLQRRREVYMYPEFWSVYVVFAPQPYG